MKYFWIGRNQSQAAETASNLCGNICGNRLIYLRWDRTSFVLSTQSVEHVDVESLTVSRKQHPPAEYPACEVGHLGPFWCLSHLFASVWRITHGWHQQTSKSRKPARNRQKDAHTKGERYLPIHHQKYVSKNIWHALSSCTIVWRKELVPGKTISGATLTSWLAFPPLRTVWWQHEL